MRVSINNVNMAFLLRNSSIWKLIHLRNLRISRSLCEIAKINTTSRVNLHHYRTLTSIAPKYDSRDLQEPKYDDRVVLSVDEAISQMDAEAKILGRVRSNRVKAIFNHIKESGKVSSIQCLYLIRTCGALMRDEFENKRIQLVNEMWDEFHRLKVPMDASHYNSLLKVYIENEYQFTPTDFLSEMEQKGITPNRVTYQRLIDKYCEDGNLGGATTILDFMKEKGMAINEGIFNSLVKCYAKTGDFEGARNIMTVMRQSNLQPSVDTYMALINGYAKKGDIESISSVMEEAKSNHIYFSTPHFLDLIFNLAVNKQKNLLTVFGYITDIFPYKAEFINTMYRLLNKDLIEDAFKLLAFVTEKEDFPNVYYLFLKHLVRSERSLEEVIDYTNVLKIKLNDNYLLQTVARFALESKEVDYIASIFNEILKQGLSIRSHYFWPILAKYSSKNDINGILKTLKIMCNLGVPADIETYKDYVIPNFSNMDVENVVKLIKETGQGEHSSLMEPLFLMYYDNCDFKNMETLFKHYQNYLDMNQMLRILASDYSPKKNCEFLVKMLKNLSKFGVPNEYGEYPDFCGQFLIQLLNQRKLHLNLLNDLYDGGVNISRTYADELCRTLRGTNPEMLPVIRNIQHTNYSLVKQANEPTQERDMYLNVRSTHVRDMTVEELEKYLEELKQNGGSTRIVLRNLLNWYCKDRNIDKVIEIEKALDELGFLYTPAIYAVMIDAFVHTNNLEEASRVKKRLEDDFPDFKLDILKVIDYTTLLIQCNRLDEALEFMKRESENQIITVVPEAKQRRIEKLFNVIVETGNAEFLRKMRDVVTSHLEVNLETVGLMRSLIKIHLKNNELDKAIDAFKHCVTNYRLFPCRNHLMKLCISKNEYEKLQNVVDIVTMHGDRIGMLHELAFIFIETHQFQQANKIFQELGGRINMRYMEDMCIRLFQMNMAFELEHLLQVTKSYHQVDRDQLYFYLLKMYSLSNDYEKALELWHTMQEENVQPSIKTLRLLADLLENNDQPIPFVIPVRPDIVDSNELPPKNVSDDNLVVEMYEHLKTENFVKIQESLKNMKKGHIRQLPTDVVSKIIELFINNDKLHEVSNNVQLMSYTLEKAHKILSPLFEKFSNEGNITVIKKLFNFVPDFTLKTLNINYYFYKTFLVNGKYDELFSEISSNFEKQLPLFSVWGFLEFLEKAPHFEPKIVKMVDDFAEKQNFYIPTKMLWIYYFTNGKEDKADEILKKNVQLFTGFDTSAQFIMKKIKATNSVDLGKRYIKFINTFNVKQVLKDKAYSCVFDVFVSQNAFEDALNLLTESQSKKIPIHVFSHYSLVQLQNSLKEKGRNLPFVIPSINDSSSSSDSD